jgi:hypothetical protein
MIEAAFLILLALAGDPAPTPEDVNLARLVQVRRVYVDRLTGDETAAQMRDMLMSSLHSSKLFIITENQDRADAILRGSAEDLVFTDTFAFEDGVNAGGSVGVSKSSGRRGSAYGSASVGDRESARVAERKHEASAAVRLVNKDGDVIWSTTQESMGGKFRGASADVADKITRQLQADYERARKRGL